MAGKIGVFCPTLNVYGGGEFVAIAIANTLAQNNHDVVLFSSDKINPTAIKNYFGETLHPKIQTLKQPTNFTPRGLRRLLPNHNPLLHRQKQMQHLHRRLLKLRLPLDTNQLHPLPIPKPFRFQLNLSIPKPSTHQPSRHPPTRHPRKKPHRLR